MGQVTLELIEPIGEPSTWNDQLVEHGLTLVQRGDYTGGRYAYLDGQERFGAVIELLEND